MAQSIRAVTRALFALGLASCVGAPTGGPVGPSSTVSDADSIASSSDSDVAAPSADAGKATDLASGQCVTVSQCPTGTGACVNHVCVAPVACKSDKQCVANGMLCQLSSGFCVACNVDADCGASESCKAHQCVPPALPCNSSKDCGSTGVCNLQAKLCVECVSSNDCDSAMFCVDTVCVPGACSPGEIDGCESPTARKVCAGDARGYISEPCPSGGSCEAGKCEVKTSCTPGSKACQANTAAVCNASGTGQTLTPCGSKATCKEGLCVEAICSPGTKQCTEAQLATCNSAGSGWTTVACPIGEECLQGACAAVKPKCQPNSVVCQLGAVVTCNAEGTDATVVPCPAGASCQNGNCVTSTCSPGATTCSGVQLATCKADGSGWSATTCPAGEECKGGKCVAGTVASCGTVTGACVDGTIAVCGASGQQWGAGQQDCVASGQVCKAGKCIAFPGCAQAASTQKVAAANGVVTAVVAKPTGGAYVLGYDGYAGGPDKPRYTGVDPDGSIAWTKTLGGGKAAAVAGVVLADESLVAVENSGQSPYNAQFRRVSPAGQTAWITQVDTTALGAGMLSHLTSVIVRKDGKLVAGGGYNGTASDSVMPSSTNSFPFVAIAAADGSSAVAVKLDKSISSTNGYVSSLAQGDGGVWAAVLQKAVPVSKIALVKLDDGGAVVTSFALTTTSQNVGVPQLLRLPGGDFVLVYAWTSISMARFSDSGQILAHQSDIIGGNIDFSAVLLGSGQYIAGPGAILDSWGNLVTKEATLYSPNGVTSEGDGAWSAQLVWAGTGKPMDLVVRRHTLWTLTDTACPSALCSKVPYKDCMDDNPCTATWCGYTTKACTASLLPDGSPCGTKMACKLGVCKPK